MSDTNFNLFKIFCVVVETENYTEASRKLYVTESTISSHIKNLEEKLNVTLFYRENGIVEGTIKGSTIKTIRFKREQRKELIEQIKQITGVYMLFSTDINNNDENK